MAAIPIKDSNAIYRKYNDLSIKCMTTKGALGCK